RAAQAWAASACGIFGPRMLPALRRTAGLWVLRHKRTRPAAMLVDDLVDLTHQADRLMDGDDDALVMDDVVLCQCAPLAVLEPLRANRVATDVEVPDVLWDLPEPPG